MRPRAFRVAIPDSTLAGLRARLAAARWPCVKGDPGWTQGADDRTMQRLVRYWLTDFDWRATERRLNELPQFRVKIDGLSVHYVAASVSKPTRLAHARRY